MHNQVMLFPRESRSFCDKASVTVSGTTRPTQARRHSTGTGKITITVANTLFRTCTHNAYAHALTCT
jgi:hypothetical protein